MKKTVLATAIASALIITGCRQTPPKTVVRFAGPTPKVFYTVERWEGPGGALSTDFTRVFAHFVNNSAEARFDVLDGEHLVIPDIRWNGEHDVVICLMSGLTNTYSNYVTLSAGGGYIQIRNHLDEHCTS